MHSCVMYESMMARKSSRSFCCCLFCKYVEVTMVMGVTSSGGIYCHDQTTAFTSGAIFSDLRKQLHISRAKNNLHLFAMSSGPTTCELTRSCCILTSSCEFIEEDHVIEQQTRRAYSFSGSRDLFASARDAQLCYNRFFRTEQTSQTQHPKPT